MDNAVVRAMDPSMKPEALAQWYLRLNGFFTITNFVVHPTHKGSQLTDGDIVGVRFPHRTEFQDGPGGDEEEFQHINNRLYFVVAEVKRGLCVMNQSWKMSGQEPIVALLQDLGPFAKCHVLDAASNLLSNGCYNTETLRASLLFIGSKFDPTLPTNALKKSWLELLEFIFARFSKHHQVKTDHDQWDNLGKELFKHFNETHASQQAFCRAVMKACNLPDDSWPILEP
ncbi:MAG: hypothetical protein JSS26_02175 [Nitrospira sp.]|nr:hypothetical protein [Nitrospira sp.]